jgi:hypothetical protein
MVRQVNNFLNKSGKRAGGYIKMMKNPDRVIQHSNNNRKKVTYNNWFIQDEPTINLL